MQSVLLATPMAPDRYEEFLRLLTKNESRLFAYILTLLPHLADAEEVLQETSIALWRSFDRFELGTDFARWARRTALHQVIAHRRRKKRDRHSFSQSLIETLAEESDRKTDLLEDRIDALATCISKLRERDRNLLAQFYSSTSTVVEIAKQMRRPVDTLYKSLARIRRTLFECINHTLAREGGP